MQKIDDTSCQTFPEWGTRFLEERQHLLEQLQTINQQVRQARLAEEATAREHAETELLRLYQLCALQRTEAVNGFIASLRMACEDAPELVAHHLKEILRQFIHDEILPVAEAVARLEKRR